MAQYILLGIAALFITIAAWDYLRTGTLHSSRKTYLLVAAIFVVVGLVLQFRK